MMMILKRKEVLIGSLIMLILVAAFINYNYSAPVPQSIESSAETESENNYESEQVGEQARKMGEAQYVSGGAEAEDSSDDYFTQAKMNKESARSKSSEMLNEIIANPNIDAESKKKAQDDLISIAEASEKEASCENLIMAKGFSSCVVYINGEEVNVSVKSDGLSGSDIAKIQEITAAQTGISIKNIKIVEVK